MPSSMIHLSVAHDYWPDAPDVFWLGNIAPDFTNERGRKDFIHLCDTPNRWDELGRLAARIDPGDPFMEGWLLHLFTDACWEEGPFRVYREEHAGTDDWFAAYLNEIGFASYWLFHHEPWAGMLWRGMLDAPLKPWNIPQGPSMEELAQHWDRVCRRHAENDSPPSSAFPPEAVRAFVRETSLRYKAWRASTAARL